MKILLPVLMALCLVSSPALAAEKRLTIGATGTSSPFYGYFVAVSQLINDKIPDMRANVAETGATVDNLKRMSRNQLDLGMVTTNILNHAYYGTKEFDGKPIKSKLLWVYSSTPQTTFVRAASAIKDWKDLNGAEINPGIRGSASEVTTEAVFKTLGITPKYFRGSASDYVSAMKDNRIVGFVGSSTGLKMSSTQLDIHTFTPLRPLSLTPEMAKAILEHHPDLTVVNIPEGSGRGVPAFTCWAFALGASAAPEMDAETAYQIVKVVMEDTVKQVGAMPSMQGADLAKMTLESGSSPLHPGAIRYFREKGLSIPDRLIAPEDK
jgi:TRAP transporter TAXI family solute receptor